MVDECAGGDAIVAGLLRDRTHAVCPMCLTTQQACVVIERSEMAARIYRHATPTPPPATMGGPAGREPGTMEPLFPSVPDDPRTVGPAAGAPPTLEVPVVADHGPAVGPVDRDPPPTLPVPVVDPDLALPSRDHRGRRGRHLQRPRSGQVVA